jgi:uncharacterized RDD family membrane protein YckC
MHRVGFWFRVLALLIDLAIFLPLVLVPLFFFHASKQFTSLALLGAWLLYSAFEVFTVGTPGKQLLGLEIANADGSEADGWKLSLRWSTKQSPVILGLLYLITGSTLLYFLGGLMQWLVAIGCLFAGTDSRQAWHDRWAQTAVFWRSRAPVPQGFPVLPGTPPPLPSATDKAE